MKKKESHVSILANCHKPHYGHCKIQISYRFCNSNLLTTSCEGSVVHSLSCGFDSSWSTCIWFHFSSERQKKKKKNSRARVETTADQNSLVSRKKNLSEMKAPLG